MKTLTLIVITIAAWLLVPTALGQNITNHVRVSAPGTPWDVVIDGIAPDIKQIATKPDGAYLLFYPSQSEVNISMYIEPAVKCKTSDECRDHVLSVGNPAWGKFENLNKASFGKFSYFEFYRPEAMGQPLQMQDIYAQYVDKGYWVDLHLSKVLYKKEQKKHFEDVMSAVSFVPKDSVGEGAAEIKKVASAWFALWDAKKCKETYDALTPYSRENVKDSLWIEYCTAAHASLGKLRSRELIAVVTTSSLPQMPGTAGASLRYKSNFGNGELVEYLSLTQGKDRSWTVSNFATMP